MPKDNVPCYAFTALVRPDLSSRAWFNAMPLMRDAASNLSVRINSRDYVDVLASFFRASEGELYQDAPFEVYLALPAGFKLIYNFSHDGCARYTLSDKVLPEHIVGFTQVHPQNGGRVFRAAENFDPERRIWHPNRPASVRGGNMASVSDVKDAHSAHEFESSFKSYNMRVVSLKEASFAEIRPAIQDLSTNPVLLGAVYAQPFKMYAQASDFDSHQTQAISEEDELAKMVVDSDDEIVHEFGGLRLR